MRKTLKLADYCTTDELLAHYRDCEDASVKAHWHMLWLKSKGLMTGKIAEVTGFNTDWVRRLIHRYNDGGPEAIRNYVKDNGRQAFLSEEQKLELFEVLKKPPADGGLWSGPKVARWVAEKTGRRAVCPQTGWEYLVALGFTLQRPRPRHQAARPDGQAYFKKNSARRPRGSGGSTRARA